MSKKNKAEKPVEEKVATPKVKKGKDKKAKDTTESAVVWDGKTTIINCPKALDALGKISSALGNELPNISVWFDNNRMYMGAAGPSMSISVLVPDSYGKGDFCLGVDTLRHMLAQRKQLEVEVTKSKVKFSSGRYKGEVVTVPFVAVKVEPAVGADVISLPSSSGIGKHFHEARTALALSNPLGGGEAQVLCVKVKGKNMIASVFDQQHAGLYRSDMEGYEGPDFSFNFKDAILRKILSLTNKADQYDVKISKDLIFIKTDTIQASMSVQQVKANSFEGIIDLIDQTTSAIVAKATVKGDEISDIVNNMMMIVEDGAAIQLEIKSNEVFLGYKTSYGKVEETFEVKTKGKGEVNISPTLILDFTGVFGNDDMTMGIAEIKRRDRISKFVVFLNGNVNYLMCTL